jgi:hypothetical protein
VVREAGAPPRAGGNGASGSSGSGSEQDAAEAGGGT